MIMAHQKSYAWIMAHSMLVLPLQIAALYGISTIKPPVHTTQGPMDLLNHVSKQSIIHCSMPSTVVQIQDCTTTPQGYPSWCQTSLTLSDAVACGWLIYLSANYLHYAKLVAVYKPLYHLDLHYWPSSPTGSRAPWELSQACQVLCW